MLVTVIIKDQITHIRYICQSIMSAAQHNRSLVEALLTEKRDLMRGKQEEMDRLVIRHRDTIVDLRQRHSEHMSKKHALLKKSEELVQGLQAMLEGLLIEMRQTKVTRRKVDKLSKRAAYAHSRCLEQEILHGSLTDEICDARATSIELKTKIEDYEVMVDYLYDKLDSQKADFDSIVHFIDSCYQEELMCSTPKHISKHCVPNSSGKGNVTCIHCSLTHACTVNYDHTFILYVIFI